MPTDELTRLADCFGSDKGDSALCAHGYTHVYSALLGEVRDQPLRLLEIGLMHGHTQEAMRGRYATVGCPSLKMWAEYLPQATLFGFDIEDFRSLAEPRMQIFQGDQGDPDDLARLASWAGAAFDIIIDDGSHASHQQQISLGSLFRHLAPGGLYCIEDLHYQPEDLEIAGITPTREFLRDLRYGRSGSRVALTQPDIALLLGEIGAIHFFDSQSTRWPLAKREDALAIITRRGKHPILGDAVRRLSGGAQESCATGAGAVTDEFAPASFFGQAAVHGQRIYCASVIGARDPTYLIVAQGNVGLPVGDAMARPPGGYRLGDEIDFRLGGNAPLFQRQGWDLPSPGGCWTVAAKAQLLLQLIDRRQDDNDFFVEMLAQGLVGSGHPETQGELFINGVLLGQLSFGYEQWHRLPFRASPGLFADEMLRLELRPLNPVSPQALGLSEDSRELGLLLTRLRIVQGGESTSATGANTDCSVSRKAAGE